MTEEDAQYEGCAVELCFDTVSFYSIETWVI